MHVDVLGTSVCGDTKYAQIGLRIGSKSVMAPASCGLTTRRPRAAQWARARKDPRWVRVKIAKILSRLIIAIVGGRQLFPHPCCQQRHYILGKLLAFHSEHGTNLVATRQDLEAAAQQLPAPRRAVEAEPLQQQLDALANRRGPQPLAQILPLVLARLAGRVVQSTPSESAGL